MFIVTSERTLSVPSAVATVAELKAFVAAREGVCVDEQRLMFAGKELRDELALSEYGVAEESSVHLMMRLIAGGGKKKKKAYTKPKKAKHVHKKVKLAILKYYNVDDNKTVTHLRRECEKCGPGVFMAIHSNRYYCGRCTNTLVFEKTA